MRRCDGVIDPVKPNFGRTMTKVPILHSFAYALDYRREQLSDGQLDIPFPEESPREVFPTVRRGAK
jgi:hypothetical protein